MTKVQTAYKAWVAATVTLAGTVAGAHVGMDVPLDTIVPWASGVIVSFTSGWLTYLVPNVDK